MRVVRHDLCLDETILTASSNLHNIKRKKFHENFPITIFNKTAWQPQRLSCYTALIQLMLATLSTWISC